MARIQNMLLLCASVLGAVALHADTPSAAQMQQAQARAQSAAADYSAQLRQALMAAMAEAGPIGGVEVCHTQAAEIAAEVERRHGVAIGRVGVRVRNVDNVASGWKLESLKDFAQRSAAGEAPESLMYSGASTDGRSLQMARGIRTDAVCLLCHGSSVAAEVGARIELHYPDDQATGFAEGSLRGLLWVEVPFPAPPVNESPAAQR